MLISVVDLPEFWEQNWALIKGIDGQHARKTILSDSHYLMSKLAEH
jgi:Zn-dependent M32 family carboxypeptidase